MYRCGSIAPMKNRKLLIPVRCSTRNFYLQPPPPGRNDWHVRFVPPSTDGVRREIFRSTGTKEIPAAKRIAAQIIESFWTDAGRGAERLKLRHDHATIGELIERYRESAAQRPATIRSNARSLRMIVKTVYSGDPDQKSTALLTANLIREFEKRQIERAEKRVPPAPRSKFIERVRFSTSQLNVRHARSNDCGDQLPPIQIKTIPIHMTVTSIKSVCSTNKKRMVWVRLAARIHSNHAVSQPAPTGNTSVR